MYSPKGNQTIIEEIKDEYIRGGHDLCFVQQRERFYKNLEERFESFDYISHSLEICNRKTLMHLVQKGTRFGIFSGTGISIIIPIEYLQLVPIDLGRNHGIQFMAMNDKFKWGIPNWDKETEVGVVPPATFDGIIMDKETEILPFEFDDINVPTDDFYPVKYQGRWGLYYARKKEMVIEAQYEDAIDLAEGLLAVKKNGKWGFVDIFNKVVVPFEYESVSVFSGGYSHAIKYSFMEDEVPVLLDHYGNETFFKIHKLADNEYRAKIRIKESYENHNRYYYAVGPDEEILIPKNKYRYLGDYREGLFEASLDGETYGYIDINEQIVIPFQYQIESWSSPFDGREFHFGLSCVKLNNSKYSRECILINHHNEQIFPYIFHCDFLRYSNGYFAPGGGWGNLGDRFKRGQISIYDLICCEQGKDMSHLIRTDAEIEVEQRRRKRQRELEEPYQWTEEDAWDAMTDGMYGDYPGGDVDYDVFGF